MKRKLLLILLLLHLVYRMIYGKLLWSLHVPFSLMLLIVILRPKKHEKMLLGQSFQQL